MLFFNIYFLFFKLIPQLSVKRHFKSRLLTVLPMSSGSSHEQVFTFNMRSSGRSELAKGQKPPCVDRTGLPFLCQKLFLFKGILIESAPRTNPIFGKIFPCSAGSYAVIRIADCGIIYIAAGANMLRHKSSSLNYLKYLLRRPSNALPCLTSILTQWPHCNR